MTSFSAMIVSYIMTAFSIAAIVLNLFLLPLIAFRSGKEIGSYKVLLFLYTFIAIIYTSVTFLMVPVFEPSEKGWLFYATVQRLPQELGSYIICLFSTCYIKLLLILTYSFLYRFFVMCRPQELRWFHQPHLILVLVLVYFAILAICAGPVVSYMRMNKEIADNFADGVGDLHIDLQSVSYIGSPMFANGHIVWETAGILTIWTCVIMVSSGISMFCIYHIINVFRGAAAVSPMNSSSRRIQQRLFMLLILQTLVPLCFTFIPCLLSYGLAYLGTHAPIISQTSSALMPLAQVVDPILIFSMISEYRRSVVVLFRRHVLRQVVSSSVVRDVSNSKTYQADTHKNTGSNNFETLA